MTDLMPQARAEAALEKAVNALNLSVQTMVPTLNALILALGGVTQALNTFTGTGSSSTGSRGGETGGGVGRAVELEITGKALLKTDSALSTSATRSGLLQSAPVEHLQPAEAILQRVVDHLAGLPIAVKGVEFSTQQVRTPPVSDDEAQCDRDGKSGSSADDGSSKSPDTPLCNDGADDDQADDGSHAGASSKAKGKMPAQEVQPASAVQDGPAMPHPVAINEEVARFPTRVLEGCEKSGAPVVCREQTSEDGRPYIQHGTTRKGKVKSSSVLFIRKKDKRFLYKGLKSSQADADSLADDFESLNPSGDTLENLLEPRRLDPYENPFLVWRGDKWDVQEIYLKIMIAHAIKANFSEGWKNMRPFYQ
ncbi:hypothetical protein HK101_001366 [Irineochytrium annulatum]|nr:hypothetical protein HK101_001366 [Irineochytrium annulatum]